MDIQARKLILIEELLKISDSNLISRIENFLKKEIEISHQRNLKPMTLDEFHSQIEKAKLDSIEGRVISHKDLAEKVKSWK